MTRRRSRRKAVEGKQNPRKQIKGKSGRKAKAGRKESKGKRKESKGLREDRQHSFCRLLSVCYTNISRHRSKERAPFSRFGADPAAERDAPLHFWWSKIDSRRSGGRHICPLPFGSPLLSKICSIAGISGKGKRFSILVRGRVVPRGPIRAPRSRAPSRRRAASRSGLARRRSAASAPAATRRGGTPRRAAGRSPDPARLRKR